MDRITPRQACAWCFCALSVPAAAALPGMNWLWVLAGSAAACGIGLVLLGMQRRAACDMSQALLRAFGTVGGRAVVVALMVWLLAAASAAAGLCRNGFAQELGRLSPAVPLLLAALMCRQGKVSAARSCGVMTLFLIILYSIITVGALRQVQPEWCIPGGTEADLGKSLCLCLTPVCVLFALRGTELPRVGWGYVAASVALPSLLAFLTAACLSPELARAETLPLYTLTKSLSVLSVMQRFEVLLSAAQLMGLVGLLSLLVCAAQSLSGTLEEKTHGRGLAGVFCALAFGGSFLTEWVPGWVWPVGAAIFWGILPILTQIIVNIKNNEKI